MRSLLRVVFALVMSFSAIGAPALLVDGVAAEGAKVFFSSNAVRLCEDTTVDPPTYIAALNWQPVNVAEVRFSLTDTSLDWTTGWIEVKNPHGGAHWEYVNQTFDKILIQATLIDGNTYEVSFDTGACSDDISMPPAPSGYRYDPDQLVQYCSFSSWTGLERNGQNTLGDLILYGNGLVTVETDGSFNVHWEDRYLGECDGRTQSAPGIELVDSPESIVTFCKDGVTSTSVAYDFPGFNRILTGKGGPGSGPDMTQNWIDWNEVDAGMTAGPCETGTPAPTEVGHNTLSVEIVLANGASVEGAPWDLYAPQAAAQVSLLPYTSGVVGANNMIEIPGLIAGEYRLVVSPEGMAPIEATLSVSDQPVTAAAITVAADGTVSVAYAAQVAPTTAPGETPQPTATQVAGSGTTGSGTTGSGSGSGSGVSGLPETGTGAESSATSSVIIALATAASVLAVGSLMIRRKSI